jgi:predicted  nucleic acid-binding Zn-ribbon protein
LPDEDPSYTKNAFAYHGLRMNQYQIDSATGYIQRTKKWQELANAMQESWDIEDRVNQINKEIDELEKLPMRSQDDILNINQRIADLQFE